MLGGLNLVLYAVCKNKNFFKSMKSIDEGIVLFMKNSTTTHVLGIGDVELKFSSGSILMPTNVFYVPKVRKNLVSGGLLNKFGFKLVLRLISLYCLKGVCLWERVIFVMVCSN